MAPSEATVREPSRLVARSEGLELLLPENEKGIGAVIAAPDSTHLIEGVRVQPATIWPDDRGYFLEIERLGKGLAAGFPPERTQVSAAMNYPGTIKAFHYHLHQTDCWTPIVGMFQIALCDLREGSPTYGRRNTMYVGVLRPWQILIPPGIAHGYKIISQEPSVLVYMTDQFYNPADEGRIPHDGAGIHYDWETQHK
jgi:dTDP-4-dehydrorhamnose 3,5-epimerase